MMFLRIAGLVSESVVDGPGIRFTVFAQGCPHRCPGCHNPQTHPFEGGLTISVLAVIRAIRKVIHTLDGVTFSGGEPFCQPEPLAFIARWCRRKGLPVMCYSGYTYETLAADPKTRLLLDQIDVLVDGPFMIANRSLDLRFRGSANQRLLDLRKVRSGRPIEAALLA